jgi:hypothetical protein
MYGKEIPHFFTVQPPIYPSSLSLGLFSLCVVFSEPTCQFLQQQENLVRFDSSLSVGQVLEKAIQERGGVCDHY